MSRVEMAQQVAIEDLFEYGSVDGNNEWMENGLFPLGFDGARRVQHDQRVGRCRRKGVVCVWIDEMHVECGWNWVLGLKG